MVEGVIFTALRSLVSDRCYAAVFPQPQGVLPTWPAIRYTVISRVNEGDICGTDDTRTDDTRVQIDIVTFTHGATLALQDQVISAMMALDPPATRQSGFGPVFDEETKTYRTSLDYLFCASSLAGSP